MGCCASHGPFLACIPAALLSLRSIGLGTAHLAMRMTLGALRVLSTAGALKLGAKTGLPVRARPRGGGGAVRRAGVARPAGGFVLRSIFID
jgi:hypothetical protein